MALNPLVDSRDVRFVLYEMLGVDGLTKYDKFSQFDKDMFEETLNLAENIAVEHFYPANREGDKIGAQYDAQTKEVRVPEPYKKAFREFLDAGFLTMMLDADHGGMGLPTAVGMSCMEYFSSGCTSLTMYATTAAAAHLIVSYGTEEQKEMYLPKMLTGEWGGDMCITEPDAGSDVGNLKTKAVREPDGSFLLTGQKIFISCGEHDMAKNMIHPVMARIEGDPAGTKGISLFLVSKYHIKPDGSLGDRNDMVCSGIEHKMGLKGNATCTLSFGDNGKCVGYLLGKERQGMKVMFQMMNEARVFTGLQSLSQSTAAYMHAITYAKNRMQGAHITQMMNPDAPKVPIIEHVDVKRMLLFQKAYVEGMRMLVYYLSYNLDLSMVLDEQGKKEAMGCVELLTPLVKAGNSDNSWMVTAEAIQVYGGYGFCQDYPVEQYARDTKIFSIYEGTNAIQSLDLQMRKILMNPEHFNYTIWVKRVKETCEKAKGIVEDKYIAAVQKGMDKLNEAIEMFKGQLGQGQFMLLVNNATLFQQSMYMLVLAWLHLWSLTITTPKMKALVGDTKGDERNKLLNENAEAAYYSGRVLSSQFFIGYELPKFHGKMDCVLSGETAAIKATAAIFTGALEE